ncbi:hypothetical protein AB7C87_17375 [Natrarchaeobius sp. A-rgal3]|uniref:DUF7285 family protein n=1 Tax=Natrarchaeobius versutus TaxID=1679078 RepID=UPI00350FF37C
MSRWSSSRAQTEPIAAIFAVGLFVVGIGLFAVFFQGLFPASSDAVTADRTIDRIWQDVEDDGVFHAHDNGDDIDDLVAGDSLPADGTVYVEVIAVDGHEERAVAEAGFPKGYPRETSNADVRELESYVEEDGIPDDASVATQSIPVAVENEADVRSGTLRVSVW